MELYHGNGDGSFSTPRSLIPTGPNPGRLLVADFDGDGWPDVVTIGSGPTISTVLAAGTAASRRPSRTP